MIKKTVLLGITGGLFSTLVSYVYTSFYKDIIVDFTEAASISKLLSYNMLFAMIAVFLFIAISKLIKKQHLASFVMSFILSTASIAFVFILLKADDPTFKNEDAELMKDFFKGFLMPMLFFPALSWFTFKSLFIK